MPPKPVEKQPLSQAVYAMMVMGIAGALITGASFVVIQHWPLPVSIAPYFEDSLFQTGAAWGLIVGGFVGFCIGWITDEERFNDVSYK